jgi:hypothetical protein
MASRAFRSYNSSKVTGIWAKVRKMVIDNPNLDVPNVRNPLSMETQKMLHAEDSEAWHGVTGLLIFIISIGLILAIITVMIAT